MDFINLKLEHVGAGSDSGNVIEQIEAELAVIAREVMDEDHYEEKGSVTLKIEVVRHGEGVVIGPKVTASHPAIRRKSMFAYVNGKGELVTQKGHQLDLLKAMIRRGDEDAESLDELAGRVKKARESKGDAHAE